MTRIRFTLWSKMMGSMVGLVLVTLIVVLISVSQLLDSRIRQDITRNFEETGRLFERIQEIRFRLLYQTAILLADVPILKGAISTGDQETVTQIIQNGLTPLLDFDPILPDSLLTEDYFYNQDSLGVLLVLDKNGYPLGQLGSLPLPSHSLADRPGIQEALSGVYPDRIFIWEQNNRFFNVVTVPIWLGNELLGTLSFGYPIRQIEAEQLAIDTGSEVTYFVNNSILVSSMKLDSLDKNEFSKGVYNATFEVLSKKEAVINQIDIGADPWIVYVSSMLPVDAFQAGIPGFYAVARRLDVELNPLRELQRLIYIFGIFAIFAAAGVGLFLTSRINRPIHLLIDGIRRIEDGDYSKDVPVVTNDELSILTQTFNRLVTNLRERLLMLKFVSKATLEAIQKNLNSVEPGGTRKQVTVFFSDVRGFTQWSEKRAPEEVIEMVNSCLHMQADIVRECGGDIDKFVGDELVAVFEGDKKEANAVEAAIRIQHKMAETVNQNHNIHVGIGINTGEVVMGAVGSHDRMDYTVIGNNVNIGARLCSTAGPGQILVSKSVYERLERRIKVQPLESVKVKGIENPIDIFDVLWQQKETT